MDYSELAAGLLGQMQSLQRTTIFKTIYEAVQGELFALFFISNQNCDVLPGEIGSRMGVTSARTANTLNSLEKKGLITREIDKSDRRKILVKITQEGKELAEKHKQVILGNAAKMFELLGEDDAKEYVRIITKLAVTLKENDDLLKEA